MPLPLLLDGAILSPKAAFLRWPASLSARSAAQRESPKAVKPLASSSSTRARHSQFAIRAQVFARTERIQAGQLAGSPASKLAGVGPSKVGSLVFAQTKIAAASGQRAKPLSSSSVGQTQSARDWLSNVSQFRALSLARSPALSPCKQPSGCDHHSKTIPSARSTCCCCCCCRRPPPRPPPRWLA